MKPKQEKQVQIPLRLLNDISIVLGALYSISKDTMNKDNILYVESVISEIKGKFEAMERHDTFTRYKTSEPNTEAREELRKQYLEQAGTSKGFITQTEVKGF